MDNPYSPPKTEINYRERVMNVRGGYYTDGKSKPLDCQQAWVAFSEGEYLVKYTAPAARKKLIIIYCVLVILFALLLGLSFWIFNVILYYIIQRILHRIYTRKVKFDLTKSEILVDRKRGILGIRKMHEGQPVFIGCRPKKLSEVLTRAS